MFKKSIRSLDNKIYKINNIYIGNISKDSSLYLASNNELVGENKDLIIYNQNNDNLLVSKATTITRDIEESKYNLNDGTSYSLYDLEYHINESDQFSQLKIKNGDLYYYVIEDLEGNKDLNFLEFSYNHLLSMNNFCFIPKNRNIGIYNLETDKKEGLITIDFSDKYKNSEFLYSVGLISDIHYNDTDDDTQNSDPDTYYEDGSQYYSDLRNILQFLKNKNIKFISCAGDITTNYRTHENNYKYCVNKYSQQSIFTCSGNHDTIAKAYELAENGPVVGSHTFKYTDIDIIQKNTNFTIHRITEEYPNDDDGTSYWFSYNNDVYIYLNVNYGKSYKEGTDSISYEAGWSDHNPRMLTSDEINTYYSQESQYADSDKNYHLYTPTSLVWLSNLLERFRDQRCFIFTHLMWRDGAGNYKGPIGYYEYFEGDSRKDTLHGVQGIYLKNLRDSYSNNVWFSGHSHYEWIWQTIDEDISIAKHNNSYTFHIPSLARPLKINKTRYKDNYSNVLNIENSEFGIMDVYNDHIEIHGYVGFDNTNCYGNITNTCENAYLYPISQMSTISSSNFSSHVFYDPNDFPTKNNNLGNWQISNNSNVEVNYITSGTWTNYIQIKCKNYNYITFEPINYQNYNAIDILFEDVKIFPYYKEDSNFTDDINSIPDNLNINNKGYFGIYSLGSYYTPQTDRSMFLGVDPQNMFFSLKDFNNLSDTSHLNMQNLDNFIHQNGFTIYFKLYYKLYNVPTENKEFIHYYNKITPIANFSIDIQNQKIS